MDDIILINKLIDNNIYKKLIKGIYEIETYYRPSWFRKFEYLYLVFSCISNWIVGSPVPNVTVGKLQIGILNYLRYDGREFTNKHLKYINKVSIKELYNILRLIRIDRSIYVCEWLINDILKDKKFYSLQTKARYIGLAYNGSYKYANELENKCIE